MQVKIREATGSLTPGTDSELLVQVLDALAPRAEILAVKLEVEGDAKSTIAATVTLIAADVDIILDKLVKRVRGSYNSETNNISMTPKRLRRVAARLTGRDAAVEDIGAGTVFNVNAGATIRFRIPILIPFYVRDFMFRNALCPSGRQLNKGGEFTIETRDSAGWTNINGLAGGGGAIIVTNVKVVAYAYRLHESRDEDFCAAPLFFRERSWSSNPETETGPFLDLFMGLAATPAVSEAALGALNITADGELVAKGVLPTVYARGLLAMGESMDGLKALDITAGVEGVTPLFCPIGCVQADEDEWPVIDRERILEATAVTGTVNQTIILVRAGTITGANTVAHIGKMLTDLKRTGLAFGDLAVKGGGAPGNGLRSDYKPRYLAPSTSARAAA
jgi:hypothetical protein